MLQPFKLIQPLKVGVAEAINSVAVLSDRTHARLGLSPIWSVIALCQTMSSFRASSFQSGFNRIQGTVLGAIYGMAVMEWLKIEKESHILICLTVWVLFCMYVNVLVR